MSNLRNRRRVSFTTGPGLTEQAHKKECDINYILRDYARTGYIAHSNKFAGTYDDVSCDDFQQAMFIVTSAQEMFSQLPSPVRRRFGEDPAAFLSFVQDPNNKDEMAKMGILKGNDGIDIKGAPVNVPQPGQVYDKPPPAAPPSTTTD